MSAPPQGAPPRELARDAVRALPLYTGAESDCETDVSDSTNLWGSPPAALAAVHALADAGDGTLARYPRAYSNALSDRVLGYHGFTPGAGTGVVVGCGSDDVLDSTMRAFATPGARIAYSVPTFSMISSFARLNELSTVEIPLGEHFDIDADALVESGAEIIYVCAPNNPTGTPVSRAAVERVVARARGIVVIDEAYADFAPSSLMDLAGSSGRVLVTRTFSKAFGLAGARVGYGVGSDALVDLVARARGPYKVSVPGEQAALAALADAPEALDWVRAHACTAVAMRGHLEGALAHLGLRALPSEANFVFVPLREAADVGRLMRAAGVRARVMTGLSGPAALAAEGGSGLRIGVGPQAVMDVVIGALGQALREVAPGRHASPVPGAETGR